MDNVCCPYCNGNMESIGYEQGMICDTCLFRYDALGNPDTSDMEDEDETN